MSRTFRLSLAGVVFLASALAGAGLHGLSAQQSAAHRGSGGPAGSWHEPAHFQLEEVGGAAYLLDTETGRVWVSHREAVPGRFETVRAGTRSVQSPVMRTVWAEESPDWARGR